MGNGDFVGEKKIGGLLMYGGMVGMQVGPSV